MPIDDDHRSDLSISQAHRADFRSAANSRGFEPSFTYREHNGISGRLLAEKLGVAASTLNRVLNGASRVTPEMALRLSKALGRSRENWLAMPDTHDLWVARQHIDPQGVSKLDLTDA